MRIVACNSLVLEGAHCCSLEILQNLMLWAVTADLKVLGAIAPIIKQLQANAPEVQAAAAHVLGVAASNNLRFQTDALEAEPRLLHRLVQVCQPAAFPSLKLCLMQSL